MKKLLLLLLTVTTISGFAFSQSAKKTKKVDISGSIRFQMFYDSYRSVEARDGVLLFFPVSDDGTDYVQKSKIGASSAFSRIRAKYSGGEAFGAGISGVVEGDFFGTTNGDILELRMRHTFVKMSWEKSNLLFGQSWHTIVDTDVIPGGLLVANLPYWPLMRSPQISYDYKLNSGLSITGAALVHGYHKVKGPALAQRASSLPEFAIKVKYKSENIVAGVNGGVLTLQPRDTTDTGINTSKKISTPYFGGFFRLNTSPIVFKAQAIYGQNLTHFRMIGGYGAADNTDDYDYSALNTFTAWADIATTNKVQLGLMTGYSTILGSNDDYYSLAGYTRAESVSVVYRIAPRIVLVSDKMKIGLEYSLNTAIYATATDSKGKATSTDDPVSGHRIQFSVQYDF